MEASLFERIRSQNPAICIKSWQSLKAVDDEASESQIPGYHHPEMPTFEISRSETVRGPSNE